jgi:hypothetical protein
VEAVEDRYQTIDPKIQQRFSHNFILSRNTKATCTCAIIEVVNHHWQEWAFDMLTQPSQYELRKPDNYKRCLDKPVDAKKEANKPSATARAKRDVAQLGAQTKKPISPLKVHTSMPGKSNWTTMSTSPTC